MGNLSALVADLEAAIAQHESAYRAAFASGLPYATFSEDCGAANGEIGRTLGALSKALLSRGWQPEGRHDAVSLHYVRAEAMRVLAGMGSA